MPTNAARSILLGKNKALKAFFEDDSSQDGGPSEDVVQAVRDAYGYTLDDLTLLDDDEPLD